MPLLAVRPELWMTLLNYNASTGAPEAPPPDWWHEVRALVPAWPGCCAPARTLGAAREGARGGGGGDSPTGTDSWPSSQFAAMAVMLRNSGYVRACVRVHAVYSILHACTCEPCQPCYASMCAAAVSVLSKGPAAKLLPALTGRTQQRRTALRNVHSILACPIGHRPAPSSRSSSPCPAPPSPLPFGRLMPAPLPCTSPPCPLLASLPWSRLRAGQVMLAAKLEGEQITKVKAAVHFYDERMMQVRPGRSSACWGRRPCSAGAHKPRPVARVARRAPWCGAEGTWLLGKAPRPMHPVSPV